MTPPGDRLPFNSPDLVRDLGLQSVRRPGDGGQASALGHPPPLAPPLVPPPPPPAATVQARVEPTPKDNSQIFVGESGIGGVPPLVSQIPGRVNAPVTPRDGETLGAGSQFLGQPALGTLTEAGHQATAILVQPPRPDLSRTGNGNSFLPTREESSRSGPDRKRLEGPPAKSRGGPWLDSRTELLEQFEAIAPGMVLKAWIAPQPKLKRAFDTGAPAYFYVIQRAPLAAKGLDVDVFFLGARTVKCATALGQGPFKRGNPTTLHLCLTSRCVSSKAHEQVMGTRIHSVAYQLMFLDEVTDRFCESGIKELQTALSADSRIPRPVVRPSVTAPTGPTLARVQALSAQLGPANPAGLPDGGFFGAGCLTAIGGATVEPPHPLVTPQSQVAGSLGTAEGNSAQVSTMLTQVSELLASRAAQDSENAELRRRFADQKARMGRLLSELERSKATTRSAAEDERAKVHKSPTPPRNDLREPPRDDYENRKRRGPSCDADQVRRSGRSAREKDRIREQKRERKHRRAESPRCDFRQIEELDRGLPRQSSSHRAYSPRGGAGLPSPGREIPRPSIRVAGITHAVAGGDIPGRKPGAFAGLIPRVSHRDVQAWLDAQIRYANAYRVEALRQMKEIKRREKAIAARARKEAKRGRKTRRSKRDRDSSSSSSSSSSIADAVKYAHIGQDTHRFRVIAQEQPGILFASVCSDFRSRLGRKGLDVEVGPQGPMFLKWYESCLQREVAPAKLEAGRPIREEMELLVTALDELHGGRVTEVADILATRIRMLAFGVETGLWNVAEQFLGYSVKENSLIDDATVSQALKLEKEQRRREADLEAVRKYAGKKSSR